MTRRPSAREDLLAARRDWRANFRFKRRMRALRSPTKRRPFRAGLLGPGWPLLLRFAGRKIDWRTRLRFAQDDRGKWGLRP